MNIVKTAITTLLCAVSVQACAVGGMADLNVYDRNEGRNLPVYWHEGRAWVVGKPGNEYQLSLRSRQGEDVLAVLSVDGINVVTGETAHPRQSGYVLSPGRVLDVRGWRKNMERTAAFYFTSLPDSYAARTGRPDNVGVIGLALFRRKAQEPAAVAQSDSLARRERSDNASRAPAAAAAEPQLGTGHGRQEVSPARYVGFERASSEPAETITLYYDSYANLVARGVIRAPLPPRRALPEPFPGFVPDPPG